MLLEITKAILVTGHGADRVSLETNLPQGVFPYDEENLSLSFMVTRGKGLEYLEKHFSNLPVVVLQNTFVENVFKGN